MALSSLIVMLTAVAASADPIVYDQPAQSPVASPRASQNQGGGAIEFQTWDNFLLALSTTVTEVSWQGSYFNSDPNASPSAPSANSTGFVVGFYADSAGTPGGLLQQQTFSPAQANETLFGTQAAGGGFSLPLSIYTYSVVLAPSFAALGGTPYWLSIYALSPFPSATEAQWGWNGSNSGDGFSTQYQNGPTVVREIDRTFALEGITAQVPEPASLLLLGSGLAALVARLRGRR
jgi:hypothetical protein